MALHAFVGHVGRATELLAALQEHLDDHMGVSPDGVHWGHVGSACKAVQDLEELCRFLGVRA